MKKRLLGFTGSAIVFVGVFAPMMSVPLMGDISYFNNGQGDGVIVLLLAIFSAVLVAGEVYKGLWFTGIGVLSILLYTVINFYVKMSEAKAKMETELANNPFRGLGDLALQSVQLKWGLPLLVIGAILIIVSAAIREE